MTANPGMDYAYFSITPWLQTKLIDAGDGKYEIVIIVRLTPPLRVPCDLTIHLVLQSPPDCPLCVVNTIVDGMEGLATSDLVIAHPTRPGMWKLFGRRDDQIVLSNGEKVRALLRVSVYHRVCVSLHKLSVKSITSRCDMMLAMRMHTADAEIAERGVNEDPLVQDSIVFGNGKFQNGVLVQPTPESSIDPSNEGAVAMFRNLIW